MMLFCWHWIAFRNVNKVLAAKANVLLLLARPCYLGRVRTQPAHHSPPLEKNLSNSLSLIVFIYKIEIKTNNYLFPLLRMRDLYSPFRVCQRLLWGSSNLWLIKHSIMCNSSHSPPCHCLILTHLSQLNLSKEKEMKFKTLIAALLFYAHRILYFLCI